MRLSLILLLCFLLPTACHAPKEGRLAEAGESVEEEFGTLDTSERSSSSKLFEAISDHWRDCRSGWSFVGRAFTRNLARDSERMADLFR